MPDPQTANTLFVEQPPLLSAFFLVVLYTAPFFAILAGCDQFASDLGNGFLRFLSARCLRIEIFLGRYLGAYCLLSAAYLCAAAAAVILSSHNLYEIEDICTRVLVIDKGRLINDSDISGLSRDSDTLTIRLDRELHADTRALLEQLPEVTELKSDGSAPGRIIIHVASPDINRVQLQVQGLLVDNGYGVLGLTRGKTLADGVFKMMEGH